VCGPQQSLDLAGYQAFFASLPPENQQAVVQRWGAPVRPMLRQGAS
jgi:cobaltochelatase CobN